MLTPTCQLTRIPKNLAPFYALTVIILIMVYQILYDPLPDLFNTFCLEKNITRLDQSICTYGRFDKVAVLYIDGMPYYFAKHFEDTYKVIFSIHTPLG
jgi:hypothetical protein